MSGELRANFGVGEAVGDSTGAAAQRPVPADFDCANNGSSRPVGRNPFFVAIPTTSPSASTTGAPAASLGIAPLIWNASFFASVLSVVIVAAATGCSLW